MAGQASTLPNLTLSFRSSAASGRIALLRGRVACPRCASGVCRPVPREHPSRESQTSTAQHRQTEMLLGTAAEDPCSGSSRRTPVRPETNLMLNSRARWTRCSRVPANAGLCTLGLRRSPCLDKMSSLPNLHPAVCWVESLQLPSRSPSWAPEGEDLVEWLFMLRSDDGLGSDQAAQHSSEADPRGCRSQLLASTGS